MRTFSHITFKIPGNFHLKCATEAFVNNLLFYYYKFQVSHQTNENYCLLQQALKGIKKNLKGNQRKTVEKYDF